MKFTKIVSIFALSTMLFTSCDDQVMDWYKDPSHGEITNADLPLKLAEKISRYDVLKSYTSFTLGAGIDDAMYLKDATYRKLTSENFDEVTLGYSMKHGAMVNAKGEINFTNVDAFMAKAKEDGLTVFGHTLVWHSNQNASYLNGLLAPTIIPGSSGTNVLDLAPLKAKTFTGWANWNKGAGITIEDAAGLGSGTPAIKLISSSTSAAYYSLQLGTPEIPIVSGHKYEISFYIKSDKAGQGRLSFADLANNYPYKDWYATGGDWTESFATTSQWQQVKITVNDFSKATFKMNIDLGKLPDVTYFIDLNSLSVVDKDATPTVVNLLNNGTFDTNLTGWSKYNGATDPVQVTGTEAYQGNGAMKVETATANSGSEWKTQIHADFTSKLVSGKSYKVSYMIRSDAAGSVRCSTTGTAQYQGNQATSTTWKLVEWTITGGGTEAGLNFDLGLIVGNYYIDNVLVTSGETTGGPTPPIVVEKTPAEKTALIGAAMEDWITKMMAHYKADVHAWDVVNEPIKDGNTGDVRDGNVTDPSADTFYWVKYLGKDYAVTAFKLAREKGNGSSDKLFINDYNLESNLEKCQGLIDYVAYIESKGAFVDGIGTQMHISTSANKDKMVQMFQKLAATGKLIKISELDITVGTKTPTVDQQAAQAEMYQFVLDSYMKYIPAPQRYGVTAWGISDSATEHEYWLKDDAPNLWDGTYARKHAYKGFSDGLAGRDVSLEFSGEIQ